MTQKQNHLSFKNMTQKQNDLLLKDLCARVPYGVKVKSKIPINQNEYKEIVGQVTSVHYNISIVQVEGFDVISDYSPHFEIRPYLFPLSTMTEEQKEEHQDLIKNHYSFDANGNVFTLQDFYCKNHLDYRGFIPEGLAIDATGKNIY